MDSLVDLGSSSNEGDDVDERPSGVRWPPLGAADADEELNYADLISAFPSDADRVKDLEEQQELLNSSLIALTSHFAQVQFRLRQIVEAEPQDKEVLLHDLEEFAFRGIPEITETINLPILNKDSKKVEDAVLEQKNKQKELINQLKTQLEELESYAYEMGEAGLPQSVIVEKQRVIIDELKGKLNLNVEDIDRLTLEDIRDQVDSAISQLVNPLKMKEQLVIQLKTQITDLERFIEFLQGDSWEEAIESAMEMKKDKNCDCQCNFNDPISKGKNTTSTVNHSFKTTSANVNPDEAKGKALNMIRRAAALLQLFAVSQFGCGANSIRLNSLKKSMKINHWGDLRARLELAVVNILALSAEFNRQSSPCCGYSSDNDTLPANCDVNMTTAVRKQLAISIRDLMQHGLCYVNQNTSLVPLMGCFAIKSKELSTPMHAWELVLRYYDIKNGPSFNATPVRKLSQSFNLNIVGSKAISNKQTMLSAIGNIVTAHTQFKRSYDAQFKAFVCAALNCKKLVLWLRLIFRCQPIISTYYEPWSYVAKTGFEDSLQSLDKLTHINFELPADLAIQPFQNIKDAF